MSRPRILLVEDDENLRIGLADNLGDEGYDVTQAATVADAKAALTDVDFDLFVLDVMLPDGDGYSFCEHLRQDGHTGMVLMLTARSLEEDLVRGFDAGADDYVAKPYRLRELLVRVRALLRRRGHKPADANRVVIGDIEVDRERRVVTKAGAEVSLTKTEYDLWCLLVDNASRVLPRDAILDQVWGKDVSVEVRTVDNFISSLKKKLDKKRDARFRIQTVRGVGYRLDLLTDD